jgi:hypothetical protein
MKPRFPDEWCRPVLYLRSSQGDGGRLLQMEDGPSAVVDPRADPSHPLLALLQAQYDAALKQSILETGAAKERHRQQAEQIACEMDALRQSLRLSPSGARQ